MFESKISGAAEVKFPRCENVHARRVVWSYEMERHAKTCSEKCCDLAEKKIPIVQSFNPVCSVDHNDKKKLETVWELTDVCSESVMKCLYFTRIRRTEHSSLHKRIYSGSDQLEKSLWQTQSSFDFLDSSHKWPFVIAVMRAIQHSVVDWVYSKTQMLDDVLEDSKST